MNTAVQTPVEKEKIRYTKIKMWDIINAAGIVQISAPQILRGNHFKLD